MNQKRQTWFALCGAIGLCLSISALACGTVTDVDLPDDDAGADACPDGGEDAGPDCGGGTGGSTTP